MAKQTEKKEVIKDEVITPSTSHDNVLTPETDDAVKASEAISTSADSKTQEYADTKESKDKVKEHEDFVNDVEKGKKTVSGESPADLAAATQPLVADPKSGEAKYVSADAWLKAEQAKGNL